MKLIRDHIPGMPEDAYVAVSSERALDFLKDKLHEEIQELIDSDYKDVYEYADVLEVLMELSKRMKIDWRHIETARNIKRKERGGFSNKILKDES